MREREREREIMCAACSIISVLTQWGTTLAIQLRERERDLLIDGAGAPLSTDLDLTQHIYIRTRQAIGRKTRRL